MTNPDDCVVHSANSSYVCSYDACSAGQMGVDLCLSSIDKCGPNAGWGLLLEVIIFVYSFMALASICDKYLVVSLETLCARNYVR